MNSISIDKGSAATVQRSGIAAFKEPLQHFLSIVQSCRTENGCIKMLQSSIGGNITLTSSSKRLFSNLSIRKPVIQLLVSAAQGHLDAYSDFGLFLTVFSANLALKSMNSNMNLKILAECYEEFLALCLQHLDSPKCRFKYSALLSNLTFVKSFVKTILSSKPLCALNKDDLSHVSNILIDLFLHTVSNGSPDAHIADSVYIVIQSGLNVMKSTKLDGFAVQAPDLSKFKVQFIHPKKSYVNNCEHIKLALVSVSMSGDLEELSAASYEVSTDISWDSAVLDSLSNFCDSLIQSDVGIVLCQKVIHPCLKVQFRKAGVITVDRVGSYPLKFISTLSGCKPIQCVDTSVPDGCYGYINDLKHEIMNNQSYLLLTSTNSPVSTLLLCHNQEEPLNELKDVCMTCIDGLQQLLYVPYVLAGGGCWQTCLCTYLQNKVKNKFEELSVKLEVPVSVIKASLEVFSDSLIETTLHDQHKIFIDSTTGHMCTDTIQSDLNCETQYCGCQLHKVCYENKCINDEIDGLNIRSNLLVSDIDPEDVLRSRDTVIDGFRPAVKAFQTAVLTACSILKIGQVVENV